MLRLTVLFLGFICSVHCQSWASEAKVANGNQYFMELMQETIYEVERKGWSNLGLLDITQTLNEYMYGWVVAGTVTYKNGFLISIQKIDLEKMRSSVITRTVNNENHTIAQMTGSLNFHDVEIGYDVVANLTDGEVQYFTGTYVYPTITFPCTIQKNMKTNEIASAARLDSLSAAGLRRMRYLPATNVTEVISRKHIPASTFDGIELWGRNLIAPIMKDIATNKLIEFPTICFNC